MISNLSDFSTKSWYNQPVRSRHFLNVGSIGTIPFERSVPMIINCRPLLAHSQSIHSLSPRARALWPHLMIYLPSIAKPFALRLLQRPFYMHYSNQREKVPLRMH